MFWIFTFIPNSYLNINSCLNKPEARLILNHLPGFWCILLGSSKSVVAVATMYFTRTRLNYVSLKRTSHISLLLCYKSSGHVVLHEIILKVSTNHNKKIAYRNIYFCQIKTKWGSFVEDLTYIMSPFPIASMFVYFQKIYSALPC